MVGGGCGPVWLLLSRLQRERCDFREEREREIERNIDKREEEERKRE